MGDGILSLPRQCEEAWESVQSLYLPEEYRSAENVIIVGMGGSAIGGALLQSMIDRECPVPVTVCREYTVPAWVGPATLVIATSYSGNTEETLAAFEDSVSRGAMPIAIARGGRLKQRAQAGIPFFQITYAGQPRTALGHSLIPLVGIFQRLGLIRDHTADVAEAVRVMDDLQAEIGPVVPVERNPAKQLAIRLQGTIPVIYGAEHLSEVARRWKGQINENAKGFAAHDVLPELNHNTIVGYEHPHPAGAKVFVVFLHSELYHPRVALRWGATSELLVKNSIPHVQVSARGTTRLAQVLSAIHYGDCVSYYLALLNGVDPSSVDAIDYLKGRLAKA
jgi:glucose/mannose-6-phosphate isomerase